jgi:hypothetical protein
MGRLIRHGFLRRLGSACLCLAEPVGALMAAMVLPAYGTLLVAAIGKTVLLQAGQAAASAAAIALSVIAVGAEIKIRAAFATRALPDAEKYFAMIRRHMGARAELDNGDVFVAG